MLIGVVHVARGIRYRWRPVLAGTGLTVTGLLLRGSMLGVIAFPGIWFLLYAPLTPASPGASGKWRAELVRELSAYPAPTHRRDLEATLARYPDDVTRELRDILMT
jgi:hypothetical protein